MEIPTFDALQESVGTWADRNFANTRNPIHPLFGMIEEVCELASAEFQQRNIAMWPHHESLAPDEHFLAMAGFFGEIARAHLKTAQGIKGTPEEHGESAKTALLGLMMVGRQYFGNEVIMDTARRVLASTPVLLRAVDTRDDAVADLFIYTADYCYMTKIPAWETTVKVWSTVIQRDWIRYPQNGTTA